MRLRDPRDYGCGTGVGTTAVGCVGFGLDGRGALGPPPPHVGTRNDAGIHVAVPNSNPRITSRRRDNPSFTSLSYRDRPRLSTMVLRRFMKASYATTVAKGVINSCGWGGGRGIRTPGPFGLPFSRRLPSTSRPSLHVTRRSHRRPTGKLGATTCAQDNARSHMPSTFSSQHARWETQSPRAGSADPAERRRGDQCRSPTHPPVASRVASLR